MSVSVVKFVRGPNGGWLVMVGRGGDAVTYATDWRRVGDITRIRNYQRRNRVEGYLVDVAGSEPITVAVREGESAATALARARGVASRLAELGSAP